VNTLYVTEEVVFKSASKVAEMVWK